MSQFAKFPPFTLLALFLLTLLGPTTGCTKPGMDSKAVAMHRTRLSLSEEPDGVQTVSDVRSTLLGESTDAHGDAHGDGDSDHDSGDGHLDHAPGAHFQATDSQAITVVGHIGGLANPWAEVHPDYPFAKTQAVFFLADPQAIVDNEESGHAHAPGEECAFCAANAADKADMLAMVRFVDEKGDVLPLDVRELFDLEEKDTVVVRGQARVTEGGILVIDAQGLYIRK